MLLRPFLFAPGVFLFLSVLLAGGCDRALPGTTVVEFWALGREGEVVRALIPQFEQRHPGIRVRVQQIPWSAAHEKLLTAFVGDAMPDVFQIGNTWIPEFVALRALAPLDGRIGASRVVRSGDYFPGVLATSVMEGITYGVPWYVDTRLLFYRRDLLARAGVGAPPRTRAEWLAALHRVQQNADGGSYAILLPLEEWEPQVILALGNGVSLLRDGGRWGNFESTPFRDAFALYVDLFRQGLAPPSGAAQLGNLYQEFARGRFAMYLSGPWNIGELRRRLPRSMQENWSTAPVPAAGSGYPGPSLAGGASLALSARSAHQDAAWKLIEYLSEPLQQMQFYRLSGDLPPRRAAWERSDLATDSKTRAFLTQLEAVVPAPRVPEWERIAEAIARYSEEVVRGRSTIDDALRALDREVDGMLEKRRWMLQLNARDGDGTRAAPQ